MIRATEQPHIVMEEVTDPEELARAEAQRKKFERNLAWYKAHVNEIGEHYRGKCICIAGGELFVADDPKEVVALARAAHPDDDGFFLKYVSKGRGPRIYAHRWRMAGVR